MLRDQHLLKVLILTGAFFTFFVRGDKANKTVEAKKVVKIGVILPADSHYPWSLPRTIPAIQYAIETVERNPNLLVGYKIQLNTNDSKCSDTYGPLAAMHMEIYKRAHVFLGPSCEYAVAPIARFSPIWGIPIISAGALVTAFRNKTKDYKLLTRIQGTYAKASEFFYTMSRYYNWAKIGLIYHDSSHEPNKMKSKCFFKLEAIYVLWKETYGTVPWHMSFNENRNKYNFRDILTEASYHTRSK